MSFRFAAVAFSFLLILLLAVEAGAQSDFARSHGKFLMGATQPAPSFRLGASFQPDIGIEDTDVESDLVKLNTRIGKVFGIDEDLALVTAFNYSLRNYSFDGVGALGSDLDEDLHELAIELGANWFVRDDLLLSVVFRPGIFSDLDESIDGDDFQWQGNAVGIYQWSDSLFLKLGVAIGEDFDETNVVPIAGFTWVSSDQLRVDVLLPRSATITWQPWEKRSLLVVPGIYLQGQQYHVNIGSREGDVQIQDIRADVTASYEVTEGARVSLTVGANIRGKYEVEGERGFDADADQDPSLYVGIGFGTNF
ncbi:MAG: hypothetical protein ACI8W3_000094 [Myxococcota bacterium]|jgi:hypothetical protein